MASGHTGIATLSFSDLNQIGGSGLKVILPLFGFHSRPIMAQTGYPVVVDATHAVQQPGGQGTSSGGDRRFAPVIARAAVAVGVAAVFMETHQDPDHAPSDGPNMVHLKDMPALLEGLIALDRVAKERPIAL